MKILASSKDEKHINGKEKSLRLKQAESIFDSLPEEQKEWTLNFQRTLESVDNVDIDITLNDGDVFECCGDALVVENDKLDIANHQYTLDMKQARESIDKLLRYDIDKIICYHGGIYQVDIKKEITIFWMRV